MPLTAGTRLGPYEIVAPLGAGGMGEVYRALDTRLDRIVAIKSLPQAFSGDLERLARFEREAKLLASLNHPNIAAIYGLEEVAGTPYLVLEFVDGETLGSRVARGALSTREVLEIGGQIASAIEAAHERGVVHRDLKPANVMLTASRGVKVLDFGLAKGGAPAGSSSAALSMSPTVVLSATGAGVILGTAPYMSPEQARGKAVDRRTDVWAFGCVLFECMTGRPAFAGDTASDVIARIIEREPDWEFLPGSAPTRLRELVRRCLIKDPEARPRDIGDLRRELSAIGLELSAPGTSSSAPSTPSLAVLYFENLASDKESEYFCAGITEDILTDLSKIRGLRVASRNAVARYRGAPADIPKVAAELGVGAVLEGSVRRSGDRVRITAQLINAADGFHLWAERFDRTLDDVFAVQEEIASSIASALRVALTPAESEQLIIGRPSDVRAYDLYLQGRELYGNYTDESLREALALFQQASEVDPGYALAWTGIADCYGQLCQWGRGVDVKDVTRRGLEAARHAISLNPRLPEAHKAEALNLRFAGDLAGARAALQRAIEVDPRFNPALINLVVDAFCSADLAGAERYVRRAIAVDPQDAFAWMWLSLITGFTARSEEGIATAERAAQLSSDAFYVTASRTMCAWIQLGRGQLGLTEQLWRDGAAAGIRADDLRAIGAALAARDGRADQARQWLKELKSVNGLVISSLLLLATAAVQLGELPLAVSFLQRKLAEDLTPAMARLAPGLHPLLDLAPLAPRAWDTTLVWPLEAPMMDPAVHALFREVRIESGRPQGSDLHPR